MKFLKQTALALFVTMTISMVQVMGIGFGTGFPASRPLPQCVLACTSIPRPGDNPLPKGWPIPHRENICEQDHWELAALLKPVFAFDVYPQRGPSQATKSVQIGSDSFDVGFMVIAREDGQIDIHSSGGGGTYGVGLKVGEWIYWYNLEGGSNCGTNKGALDGFLLFTDVTLTHKP